MYNLQRLGENHWSFGPSGLVSRKEGTLKEVCKFMTSLDFDMVEVEDAVNEMAWMDHDLAQFGVMKRFVFSRDTKEKVA